MAALPRLRAEAAAAVALRRAVDLAEALAVVRPGSPAAPLGGTGRVAAGAVPLPLREVVHVDVVSARTGQDFVPVDGFDVAQVVVVEEACAARQNVCQRGQRKVLMMSDYIYWKLFRFF